MLPTNMTPPKVDLSDFTVLAHGRPKAGKSELCSHAPGALFIATEAGLNSLEVFQVPVTTWEEFLKACAEVAAGGHQFKTIIIDTIDNAYRMCSEHVCAKHKIEHESDLGYGKGFSLVNGEFYRVLNKLSLLPYGLFLISHSQEREIETRTGKRIRIVPTLPEKARRMVLGMVDIILYIDIETIVGPDGKPRERRVMRTKPTELYEAGDRTGRLPDVINLDYEKFVQAFKAGTSARGPSAAAPEDADECQPPSKTSEGSQDATGPQPPAQPSSARTEEPSEPVFPVEKPKATAEQVSEFEALTKELRISPELIRQRIAEFGATEPGDLTIEAMDSILAKLRSAAKRSAAGATQA